MLFENRGYYLERGYIAEGTYEVSRICARFAHATSPAELRTFWKSKGITHVLFNETYWKGYSGDFIRRFYPDFEKNFNEFSRQFLQVVEERDAITLYEMKCIIH